MDRGISQNETIQRLCINRKEQNMDHLKAWDMKRAERLMVHRKIIDEFDESIQQKLSQSNGYIDVVRQFLTDSLNQKNKYEHQLVSNPETKIKANLAGKHLDKENTQKIGKLYQLTHNYKGFRKMKNVLESGLERVEKQLVETQKTTIEMRTKIQMKIVQIQNCNELTLVLCNNLVTIYHKDKHSKPFLSETDMYTEEQMFIYQSLVQTHTEQQLGLLMTQYLEFVETLEKQKLVLVKQVIGAYLETVKEETENGEEQFDSLMDILKKQTENKYIDECYSSEQLLSKTVIVQLCQIEAKPQKQINIKYIKHFLTTLQYSYFEYINYLVLKEYHIHMKIQQALQKITVLITVDAYLNILVQKQDKQTNKDSQQNIYQQIDLSLKIDNGLSFEDQGETTLHLTTKKLISAQPFAHLTRIECVFANDDQRQQFLEFIEKIIS